MTVYLYPNVLLYFFFQDVQTTEPTLLVFGHSFAARLKKHCPVTIAGKRIVSEGVGGATTKQISHAFVSDIIRRIGPEAVFLQIGGNEVLDDDWKDLPGRVLRLASFIYGQQGVKRVIVGQVFARFSCLRAWQWKKLPEAEKKTKKNAYERRRKLINRNIELGTVVYDNVSFRKSCLADQPKRKMFVDGVHLTLEGEIQYLKIIAGS